jgi:lipopolysaccharide transport system ATP-binding protein
MNDVILSVENISKLYRLGTFGTGTFGGDVQRFWKTKILGQEDPYLKIGQVNNRTSKEKAEFVWAIRDISFEVERGDVIGIIGKNGAGKSTLLKLLSRITAPTKGSIKCAGRMASLLEVGTGFHPELTGRENIYLNGAILGMTKKEIQNKFDEIVDFSGCELYIDTPTKRYSSGMTVRMGFAVAAFLDPDVLVVDEVLAVGDAEFQKKAIGKMKQVSSEGGRTVLFVSHNLSSIAELCNNSILIENGSLRQIGRTENVIETYLSDSKYSGIYENSNDFYVDDSLSFANVVFGDGDNFNGVLYQGGKMVLSIMFKNRSDLNKDISFTIELLNEFGVSILSMGNEYDSKPIKISSGSFQLTTDFGDCLLKTGVYSLNVFIRSGVGFGSSKKYCENFSQLKVEGNVCFNPSWKNYITNPQQGFSVIPIKTMEILENKLV